MGGAGCEDGGAGGGVWGLCRGGVVVLEVELLVGSRELCSVLLCFSTPGSVMVVGAAAGWVVSPIAGH